MDEITPASFMKQNLLGFSVQSLGLVSNLIFNILLPILLGAVIFGKLSVTLGFAYFLVGLFDAGFNFTCVGFISKFFTQKKYGEMIYSFEYLLKLKMAFALLLSAGLFIGAYWLSPAYDIPLISLQVVSILIIFFSLVTFLNSFFTAIQKNQIPLMGTFLNSVLLISLPLLFYFSGFRLTGIVLAVILTFSASSVFLLLISLSKLKSFKVKKKKVNKRPFLSAILNFSTVSILSVFTLWGILLILGFFVPSSEVAFFKVSLSWILAVVAIIPISTGVVFSSFVSLKASNSATFVKYVEKTLKYSFMILIPAMFGFFLLASKMILVVYGLDYLRASLSLAVICWAIPPLFVNKVLFSILVSFDKIKKVSKIYLTATFVGLIVTIVLSAEFGLMGACFSFVFINYLIFLLSYFSIRKFKKIRIFSKVVKPLMASIGMGLFVYWGLWLSSSILGGLMLIFLAAAVYFVLLYLIRGISRQDLKLLRMIFP